MSENRLRPFWGELFENPAPLELSFNNCDRGCSYCFARLNGRDVVGADASGTLRLIARTFGQDYDPDHFTQWLLRHRHPIVLSNAVDPLAVLNLPSTREVLRVLKKVDVPVILQTRGTRRPEDFREFVELLPRQSVVYMSITTFDAQVLDEVEHGCPSNEQRLEMMAMAAAAGFATVAAFNPTVPAWMGDPYDYVDRCEKLAGKGTIRGVWYEPLHISKRQYQAAQKAVIPPLALLPFEQAHRYEKSEIDYFDTLVDAIDEKGWGRFSYSHQVLGEGLFQLWPNPFPTHSRVTAACERLFVEEKKPVLVSFTAFANSIGVPDITIPRHDAWSYINQKQNAGEENRKVLPERVPLRACLRFLWNRPDIRSQSIRRTHFKNVVALDDGQIENGYAYVREGEEGDGDMLRIYAPDLFGISLVKAEDLREHTGFVSLPEAPPSHRQLQSAEPPPIHP